MSRASKATGLTPKQMKFCENYLQNGGKSTEAYIAAYDTEGGSFAPVEASRLLKREDIQNYIKKLRKPVEKAVIRKMVNERDYKKKVIQERLEACIARDDDAGAARWMEIWNKMDGEYVNINKDITDHKTEIGNLDNATLLKLASGD